MARDARGADWGRYYQHKSNRKISASFRKKKLPSIYLLSRFMPKAFAKGDAAYEVKIGRSVRNPSIRATEFKRDGFEMETYWPAAPKTLNRLERCVIEAFQSEFGEPTKGQETFAVESVENAINLAKLTIRENLVLIE
jgi:hypothetical protein